MRVLVVGSNGSEHALLWKLAQSPRVTEAFVTPGNAGMKNVATVLGISESVDIVRWVAENPMDLVVIRSDNYLASGLSDALRERGVRVFGPSRAAARIEWSKSFAKQFMHEEGIPTASFATFDSFGAALGYAKEQRHPLVIKADGLAFGKGVVVAQTLEETEATLRSFMLDGTLGASGASVVLEQFLIGKEISVHALTDGTRVCMFPPSKDHKRALDHDRGPNTGGMGTIVPVPYVTDDDMKRIESEIVLPTIRALARRGTSFQGLLFPGIMLTTEGPKVIEFNARFGDPETQSYMRLLESDIFDALFRAAEGDISGVTLTWRSGAVATVMLASGGYPGSYKSDFPISGLLEAESDPAVVVFHSGTHAEGEGYVTRGGRVLGVSALQETLDSALRTAYSAVEKIDFSGMQYRTDIGGFLKKSD